MMSKKEKSTTTTTTTVTIVGTTTTNDDDVVVVAGCTDNDNENDNSNDNTVTTTTTMKRTVAVPPPPPPPLPKDWDRCQAWMERKRRYCRQQPLPLVGEEGLHQYCGNHRHLFSSSVSSFSSSSLSFQQQQHQQRIPCPIDPSHWIFADKVQQHIRKCPLSKKLKRQQQQPYYQENINGGGFGNLVWDGKKEIPSLTLFRRPKQHQHQQGTEEWAQSIALRVLHVHQYIFGNKRNNNNKSTSTTTTTTPASTTANPTTVAVMVDQVTQLTEQDIYHALPLWEGEDYSSLTGDKNEISSSSSSSPSSLLLLSQGFSSHHVKSGGERRHIPQLDSLLAHLRIMNVLEPLSTTTISTSTSTSTMISKNIYNKNQDKDDDQEHDDDRSLLFLEMGAGRGMFGLAAASVANASRNNSKSNNNSNNKNNNKNNKNVHLIMVERTGSRSKAEKAFRNIPQHADTSYMKLDGVQWSRCSCDLAHVHIPTLLLQQQQQKQQQLQQETAKIVVLAKHLCGSGTDLALKSMATIRTTSSTTTTTTKKQQLQRPVDACILATCCHGACTWQDYVGRDYLHQIMTTDHTTTTTSGKADQQKQQQPSSETINSNLHNTIPPLSSFGPAEFDLLRQWCGAAASVGGGAGGGGVSVSSERKDKPGTTTITTSNVSTIKTPAQQEDHVLEHIQSNNHIIHIHPTFPSDDDDHQCHDDMDDDDKDDHYNNEHIKNNNHQNQYGMDNKSHVVTSISSVVKSLGLSCGIQGLGRACQRLIDYGRCEYLRHQVFHSSNNNINNHDDDDENDNDDEWVVNLSHYVSSAISPQNAIIWAYRNINPYKN
jgi:tRNA:m4X modification enzyme